MNRSPEVERALERRDFLRAAAAGTIVSAMGGLAVVLPQSATAKPGRRADGRPQVPPGQKVIRRLRRMGGEPGDAAVSRYRLKIHGEVERPFELSFRELLALPQTKQKSDVHCVTGWSVLGASFEGVSVAALTKKAKLKRSARYVIFEAAHGYSTNIRLRDALRPDVLVAHRLDDRPLGRAHGFPVRSLVPDLYFWKSAKWLTGIRFVTRDEPGYWEQRGYHNHADPWREQRFG